MVARRHRTRGRDAGVSLALDLLRLAVFVAFVGASALACAHLSSLIDPEEAEQ